MQRSPPYRESLNCERPFHAIAIIFSNTESGTLHDGDNSFFACRTTPRGKSLLSTVNLFMHHGLSKCFILTEGWIQTVSKLFVIPALYLSGDGRLGIANNSIGQVIDFFSQYGGIVKGRFKQCHSNPSAVSVNRCGSHRWMYFYPAF